ncbi:MAG: growth inhibitor [Bacteroidota bacterium]|jgi:mRNA interferase MazF
MAVYVPERGDIVLLSFDPTRGREQQGTRPAVVISPKLYNRASGLVLVCPVTSKSKGYPFEVAISADEGIEGVALVDQIRCVDWKARSARSIGVLTAEQIDDVLAKLRTLTD